MKGHESLPQRSEVVGLKEKEKDGEHSKPTPNASPSLEALMFDPFLFEELFLEGPYKKVFSLLGVAYGGKARKGA